MTGIPLSKRPRVHASLWERICSIFGQSERNCWAPALLALVTLLLTSFSGESSAWAQGAQGELRVEPAPDLSVYEKRPLDAVHVETLGRLWPVRVTLQSVKAGDEVRGELVRRGLRELDRSGRFAELHASLVEDEGRLILLYQVRPRRLIEQIRVKGRVLDESDEMRALGLKEGTAVTDKSLDHAATELKAFYIRSGYPEVQVRLTPEAVDDPRRVLLRVEITPGPPQALRELRFLVAPSPHHPALKAPLDSFSLQAGARLDEEGVQEAQQELEEALVAAQFFKAKVSHQILPGGILEMRVRSGPRYSVRIEGNSMFSDELLQEAMQLAEHRDPRPEMLEPLLRDFYVEHGYLDVHVEASILEDQEGLRSEVYVWLRAGERFHVARRIYPCLSGHRNAEGVSDEIDGVLSESFPQVGVIGPVSADAVDAATGSSPPISRPKPWAAEPWSSFSDENYREVMNHLQDLYRAEGYLSAKVGPATVVRRQCLPESPPGECLVSGARPLPPESCSEYEKREAEVTHTCVPDFKAGIRCEAAATLVLPIVAGRQTVLYDVVVEGNEAFASQELLRVAELGVGKPLRRAQLDGALRRIQEAYEEEAYAFVKIDSDIELSPDQTRARLVISIRERHRVEVSRIDIRGATDTSESLIRSRLALKVGELYRRSSVKRSEEQLESLAVFTSVAIALQDPGVPAREKVVVVTVVERLPQYLDIKGGFGTADGFRIGFEYGHRNLGGEAIQLVLRSQLSLRPSFLIVEQDVRDKYDRDLGTLAKRLVRRNTITLAFPEIGLGPLFRFEVEALDMRQNQRDFTQTRDSGALRLLFLPRRQYLLQLGATVEYNQVEILQTDAPPDPNLLIPEGNSVAFTQNFSAAWDRRDKPLAATRGTYLRAGVEHVTALPVNLDQDLDCAELKAGETPEVSQVCSEFLRFTGRFAGYLPISKSGLTFAFSLQSGVIQNLTKVSGTYPDRLFFMGGVDTLRGFTQDALVPQDLAEQVLDGSITIDQVSLRGGDIFVNPRAELRIPITPTFQTALFLDAGNIWYDRSTFNPLILRYTAGTGLRIKTPVGPLVFDFGFNLERLGAALSGNSKNGRTWEEIGAFHFSIGLF